MDTPWGPAQRVTQLAPGILSVVTGRHGGILVRDPDKAGLSDAVRNVGDPFRGGLAFEEDCAWWAVMYDRPDLYRAWMERDPDISDDEIRDKASERLAYWYEDWENGS